MTNIVNRV